MSRFDDYFHRMPTLRLEDRDIETLLSGESTGSEELADLEAFVAAFATDGGPPRDTAHMATALAATARSSTSRSVGNAFRRLVVLGASFAIMLAFSGVAMAANGSAPGDLLYGVDRALETVGIGNGGIDERIVEFETLLDRNQHDEAFEFLENEMRTAAPAGATAAGEHLAAARGTEAGQIDPTPGSEPSSPADPDTATTPEGTPEPGSGDVPPAPSPSPEPSGADPSADDDGSAEQGNEKSPPGQGNEDDNRAEPETAGPKEDSETASPEEDDSPSNNQGNEDPGTNGNQTDPVNNGNTDPGTPQGNATGQDQGQRQGQGQGQGQGQRQGED